MSVTAMPASARSRAVPPVDRSAMPHAASPRANSTMPDLSETDSSACATFTGSDQLVFGELGAQRVAVQPEHLRGVRLIAVRSIENRREQRAFHMRNDHVVDAVRRFAFEPAKVLIEGLYDAVADLVAAVQPDVAFHAASASGPVS